MAYSIAFFDLDRTLIPVPSIKVIARAWNFTDPLEALIKGWEEGEYPDSYITRSLLEYLEGKDLFDLYKIIETITESEGAKETIQTLKEKQILTYLVSSAYSPVVSYFTDVFGADGYLCPNLEVNEDNKIDSLLPPEFEDDGSCGCGLYLCKRKAVTALCQELGIDLAEAIAIGDGKSDTCMFDACGLSLGYQTDIAQHRIEELKETLKFIE